MGGFGSGYAAWKDRRLTVEDCRRVTIQTLRDAGYLRIGRLAHARFTWRERNPWTGEPWGDDSGWRLELDIDACRLDHARIQFHHANAKGDGSVTYTVRLDTTTLPWWGDHPFGEWSGQRFARRWWFLCPVVSCCRRCAILYRPNRAEYFACRRCYRLTYESSNEAHCFDRAMAFMAAAQGIWAVQDVLHEAREDKRMEAAVRRREKRKRQRQWREALRAQCSSQ